MIYACGPEPMLRGGRRDSPRIATAAREVSVERVMGCGMGGCYSCVVPVHAAPRTARHYVRSCIGGPVFDARAHRLGWECTDAMDLDLVSRIGSLTLQESR